MAPVRIRGAKCRSPGKPHVRNLRALLPPRNRSPSGRKSPRAEHACFTPPVSARAQVRPRARVRCGARPRHVPARHRSPRNAASDKGLQLHAPVTHLTGEKRPGRKSPRAQLACFTLPVSTRAQAVDGARLQNSASPCHCDTTPYLAGLSDRKFPAPVFRTERFRGPPALSRRRLLLLSSDRGACRSALKTGLCL